MNHSLISDELLQELIEDLRAELEQRYDSTKDHPAIQRKYQRDMAVVVRAQAVLDSPIKHSQSLISALEKIAAFKPKSAADGVDGWEEWNRAGRYVAKIARDALNTVRTPT